MLRPFLTELLQRYVARFPAEATLAERFLSFAAAHDDCLWRTCVPGHLTASAWVLSPDGGSALLLHHKKLGRWLQPGGHVDGEPRLDLAALREAREESGLQQLEFVPLSADGPMPLDLDVHPIPARGAEPAHEHFDVRFLLRAAPGQSLVLSDESHALRWCAHDELAALTDEPSVLRLRDKARQLGQTR